MGQGFPWSLPPGRHAPEIGIPREGHSVVNHRSQRTIRHSRAREWVGVLESLLTSLPHAAQNGCSNGRSLEKLLQTYSNEPKRLGVKPHETMSHFACEMLVNRTCSSLGSVRI